MVLLSYAKDDDGLFEADTGKGSWVYDTLYAIVPPALKLKPPNKYNDQ
jgi:hypothetical protein